MLLGDAELDEGSNHEAIAYAGGDRPGPLTAIVIDNESATHGWPGGIAAPVRRQRLDRHGVDGRDHDADRAALHRAHPTGRNRSSPGRPKRGLSRRCATTFVATTTALLDEDPRTAVVLADISADAFEPAARAPPGPGASTSASASS